MKNFKNITIMLMCVLFTCGSYAPSYCQTSQVTKSAAKSISRLFGKKSTKEAGEAAAKKVSKDVAEKSIKELSEEMAEKAIHQSVSKSLTAHAAKKSAQRAIRETSAGNIGKTYSKRISREVGEKLFNATSGKASSALGSKGLSAKKYWGKIGSHETRMAFEKQSRQLLSKTALEKSAKKAAIKTVNKTVGKEALKTLDDFPELKKVVQAIHQSSTSYFPENKLFVEKVGKNTKVGFAGTSTEIIVDKKGCIHATAGATPKDGAMNQFLNHPIPNKSYCIDNAAFYKTDELGRTVSIECHSSELSKIQRTQLDEQQATRAVVSRGGVHNAHDAGHLQSKSTGGSNEMINLLPMDSKAQRPGSKWYKFEDKERQAIAKGDDVWSFKTISYNNDGTYVTTAKLRIREAKTGKAKTVEKSFDDLYTLPQNKDKGKVSTEPKGRTNASAAEKYQNHKTRMPINGKAGNWSGERGNSEYVLEKDYRPKNKGYNNPNNKTIGEQAKELGDDNPAVKFKNGYPDFDKDPGTKSGKPLQAKIDEGIDKYLDIDKIRSNGGKNVNRQTLHEEVYRRMADKLGISVDELKVFKGDLAAAERLAKKWGCSVETVFARCHNPKHIQRVLHECEDGKTVKLVPRLYHDNVSHNGGIEVVVSTILSE